MRALNFADTYRYFSEQGRIEVAVVESVVADATHLNDFINTTIHTAMRREKVDTSSKTIRNMSVDGRMHYDLSFLVPPQVFLAYLRDNKDPREWCDFFPGPLRMPQHGGRHIPCINLSGMVGFADEVYRFARSKGRIIGEQRVLTLPEKISNLDDVNYDEGCWELEMSHALGSVPLEKW